LHRSKTDQEGEGTTLFLSRKAMDALVFGLGDRQIRVRIAAAAVAAGRGAVARYYQGRE